MCAGEGRGTVAPLVVQVSQQTPLARSLQRLAAVAVQGGDGGQQRGVSLSADHGHGDTDAALPLPTRRVARA